MMLLTRLSLYRLLLYSLISLHLSTRVSGAPDLSFPVNSQVPPVARAGKPFQFIFALSTFAGNISNLQYTLSDGPPWLQLDSASRRLFGTPGNSDVGPIIFNLVGSDSSGSTSDSVTLVVSNNDGPGLGVPVSQQLASLESTSESGSLLLYPASLVFVTFARNTFTNIDTLTNYYAICANNTPLPSWIKFDSSKLLFNGTTPSFDSPDELPQELDIRLTASDVVGFSAAIVTFRITIALHKFTFGSAAIVINMTSEHKIAFDGLQSALKLDGQVINPSEIISIGLQGPSWLSIDAKTLMISGVPPPNVQSQTVIVTAKDKYEDVANTTIYLTTNAQNNLLVGHVDTLQAVIGQRFIYRFSESLFPSMNMSIGVDLGNTSSWLQFDRDSLTMSGVVPPDLYPQTDFLNLTANQGSRMDFIPVTLELVSANDSLSNGSATSLPTASSTINSGSSATTTTAAAGNTDSAFNTDSQKSLAAKILIPFFGVLALGICIWWFRWKGSKSKTNEGQTRSFISRITRLRSQRPRYTIGEPQPIAQSLPRSRSPSQRWSLPRLDVNLDIFRTSGERHRSSQLLPSYRVPHSRNLSGAQEAIEESLLEDVPILQREHSAIWTQQKASPKAATRPSRRTTQRTLRTYELANKINARDGRRCGRVRMSGLGHGIVTPLPSVLYRRPGEDRLSRFQSNRADSGFGETSSYSHGFRGGSICGRGGIFDGRTMSRQPSDALSANPSDYILSSNLHSLSKEGSETANRSASVLKPTRADSTIRLVNASPPPFTSLPELVVGETSPMTKRNNYLKERRTTRGSGTILSARSLKRCSTLAYDFSANARRSEFGFSSVPRGGLSAQRKGEMMQRGTYSGFGDTIRIPVNLYRSASLMESDSRYEDLDDSDSSSWEDDQPEGDDRTWQTTEGGSSLAFP